MYTDARRLQAAPCCLVPTSISRAMHSSPMPAAFNSEDATRDAIFSPAWSTIHNAWVRIRHHQHRQQQQHRELAPDAIFITIGITNFIMTNLAP